MVAKNGVITRVMAVLCAVILAFGVCVYAGNNSVASPIVVTKADTVTSIMQGMVNDTVGQSNLDAGYQGSTDSGITLTDSSGDTKMGGLVNKAQAIVQVITGVATAIALGAVVVFTAKLAMSAGNDQARKKALTGLLWSLIALVIFGGMTLVVSFAWNFLTGLS